MNASTELGLSQLDAPNQVDGLLAALSDRLQALTAPRQIPSWPDLRAIRLVRTLSWLSLDTLPPHDSQLITSLEPLPSMRLAEHQACLSQGRHAALFHAVEADILRCPAWLDGHYLSWRSLTEPQHVFAMREIELQLASLLQRLPGLTRLRYCDGSPLASPETLDWIHHKVMPFACLSDSARPGRDSSGIAPDFRQTMERIERNILLASLYRNKGNQSQTARELGLPRRTLLYRMERLGIASHEYRLQETGGEQI